MALFEPSTIIYFLANTGVDDYNKPYFDNDGAMYAWMQGHTAYTKTGCSYQRGDERPYISVNINYYDLMDCDMVMWQNSDTDTKWLYANITGLEWVNPNLTRVYFKIDAFCSFCGSIDWGNSYSMVEREHVEDDWNGSVPNWDNIGVAEPLNVDINRVTNFIDRTFECDNYYILSPYDSSGEPVFSRYGRTASGVGQTGVYDGLQNIYRTDTAGVAEYLESVANADEAKLSNIIGVVSIPSAFRDFQIGTVQLTAPWAATNLNNAKCFCSQFCNITIEASVGGSNTYAPELFMDNSTRLSFRYQCAFAGGQGGILVGPNQYANTMWPGNADLGLAITDLPMSAFVGDAYAEWESSTRLSRGLSAMAAGLSLATAVGTAVINPPLAGGMAAMEMGANLVNGMNQVGSLYRDWKMAKKGSAMVGGNQSSGGPILGSIIDGFGFKIRAYMPIESEIASVDAYFDRYGYRVDRLKVPNRNNRPYWNYVKTSEGHVSGNIPHFYRIEIENMLNRGVTFWASGRTIGDYSNPAGNKG